MLIASLLTVVLATPQSNNTVKARITPPPSNPPVQYIGGHIPDSIILPSPVQTTLPTEYADYAGREYAADLRDPQNIKTEATFDPTTGMYVIHTRVGDMDVITPYQMSASEYHKVILRQDMQDYFRQRNAEIFADKEKKPFDILDMNFALGPLEKVFGPGGVRLTTQGSIQLNLGVKSNKTDNPALSSNQRRKTYFDFDQKIQATIAASVGDKMKFNMTYNTDATFDFDSKNLKLAYEGKEDEIIKLIEAGNVSMTTGSSLIRGSTALFGLKTKLQFGKLTLTGLISQQNSESKTVNAQGGAQTTPFSIKADDYDANRHFFLSQFFYQNYDNFAANLPHVSSGINITRIEVWVTNKSGKYDESRNFVGFMDLGENNTLATDYWQPNPAYPMPCNNSNNLLSTIKTDYPGARNINDVTQALSPLAAYGITGGRDYEKVESARLLKESEYTLNSTLGYISLKSALTSDEVLAVAYEYTYMGKVYQVGEFSSDVTSTSQSLFLKMLRGTTISPQLPMWRLMMKNVYSLGAYQLQAKKFKMNIKYLSDTTGTEIVYLPVSSISNQPLLQVMNLDRLDSNSEGNPDGIFDYIEGYTVQSSQGKIIFPVAEPFGAHLAKKIGDPVLARQYAYTELYDSTLTVARQFADKNKFNLVGEYQASGGAQIRLGAMNVPRGSVVVTAGGVVLTENSDYTVDYTMGIVTITNQSIIDAGTNISVSLENQSLFSMQRKTLLGLDAQYKFNKDFTIGATLLNFSEKALTEKVNIGDEVINNTMWGLNLSYNTKFMWLTNLLNKIPTVNATAPSSLSVTAEFANLVPHKQKSGSPSGSSYLDDFESTQTGIDLRSPYSWFLAPTPYDGGADPLFPEAGLTNNVDYGKNRALLAWYYIDRTFTQKNSSMIPGYLKNDLKQLSNPYVREIPTRELFPNREQNYAENQTIQTLNLSFYPTERGPYNMDNTRVDDEGHLLEPEKRWGGIMRKMDNTNFETSNVDYIQFWMMDPFLDPELDNTTGGDLYFNFGEISEDILKDGLKSYENGIPIDGSEQFITTSNWGRISTQNSLTYAFENAPNARPMQDVGLDGLPNNDEFTFPSYSSFLDGMRQKLSPATIETMQDDPFSIFSDPAQDNYHFFRSPWYDDHRSTILERYKHYNGVEGNSLAPDQSDNPYYQGARTVPDVEDINQDNTLNEYERYFQYKVSIRPEDLEVGKNYITDKITTYTLVRDGTTQEAVWYQFKIPLKQPDKVVGGINDWSTVRFARMFMTGFKAVTHLRFATLELVRGEWRDYEFNLNSRNDSPAEGQLDMSIVNIEENSGREPVNYVLPPDVTRIQDPSASQATLLNEQSMSLKVTDLQAGDARGAYKNTQLDLRIYKRLQMWVHAEALVDNLTNLRGGDLSLFVRLGSDVKNNYYEYEIPLTLTPPGHYNNLNSADRRIVWPEANRLNIPLSLFTDIKTQRNHARSEGEEGVGYNQLYYMHDPDDANNTVAVLGNPSLSDVRVLLVGVRNKSNSVKGGTIWVNELKVTDFDNAGGWAAKANVNLAMSDVASVNFGAHVETAGFGGVDQGLAARRLDDYEQYNVAVQGNLGRFLPEKAKLNAPIYYSISKEKSTPKYNPLDQDILLKDALDACATKAERDSISSYAVTRKTVESFSLTGLKFDVKSKTPMPWDPANFQVGFSFNKQKNIDPTTEYENTNDYKGSFQYSYAPYFKPFKPFKFIKSKNKNLKFLADWELNWIFNSLTFYTNISRYYYEQQTRSEVDVFFQLPVQVSKNFLWDRQLNLSWNLTKSLSFTFASNTTARIEETMGAVNRKLFPDKYKEWRDTVWQSIKGLGTPWNYNQTFTATYRAPFNKIPILDYLSGNVSYNATYRWDRGATVNDVFMGNTIQNQATWNADARLNFETLFGKVPYLKAVNKRFSSSTSARNNNSRNARDKNKKNPKKDKDKNAKNEPKPKQFEKAITLATDSATVVKHNLKSKKVKFTATETTKAGETPVQLRTRRIDDNTLEILDRSDSLTGPRSVKVTITEVRKSTKPSTLRNIADYTARFLMMPRSFSFKWRQSHSLNLPLFRPDVGDVFGQSRNYGPMSPGLDFAFGFIDETYINKALDRGWLLTDETQVSPAIWNNTTEFNFELNLEPIRGLKILLTNNRTDNRTSQVQFMYDGMPTTRTGSFTKTHIAIATALRSCKAQDNYASKAFSNFLEAIPVVAQRYEEQYHGVSYPGSGFLNGSPLAGTAYNPEVGSVSRTSSDVLIPAFLAAYSGSNPHKVALTAFPSLAAIRPNWRVTYDGLMQVPFISSLFKSFTLSHAYQCTYAVGSYTSYLNWIGIGGERGFTLDEQTQSPIPSSPYNISSVTITEKFAPLIGVAVTLNCGMTFNLEYRDSRTLSLNTSAGQVVEATSRQFTIGAGYKIANFNKIIKIGSRQGTVSNDLTLNFDFSLANNQSLIRKIETAFTQAQSGAKTMSINFTAQYILSRRVTLGAFFDHQVNTPLVSNSSYPTSNTNAGISLNLSLAR